MDDREQYDLAAARHPVVFHLDCEPRLGCATTGQLLEELQARVELARLLGEPLDLDYRTVAHG